ncbi:hypothetical protein BDW02DRAFT_633741 [Decorospora gaudefroyi]|uniref:Uncharacterized protein n=1 Tax=Decorospora gaudefroyi TaxID=184978 RepID=A0A6A5JZB1_9PLEO|nr:hypothetical protein BDW02DRAFT_633741 [Decorospora gaudefroyi]
MPVMADTGDSSVDQAAITSLNVRNSPLLRLPGELRIKIYGYVLRQDEYWVIGHGGPTPAWYKPGNRLALLSACRQLYQETHLLPFALNEFYFVGYYELQDFCLAIGPAGRHSIRKFRLRDSLFPALVAVSTMQSHGIPLLSLALPNVERVRVVITTDRADISSIWRTGGMYRLLNWSRHGMGEHVDVQIELLQI